MVLDGEGGFLSVPIIGMNVHIFRTKMPSPDREGPFSGSHIKIVIDDERVPA